MSAGLEAFANDGIQRLSLNIGNSLPMIDESAIDEESLASEAAEIHNNRGSSISHEGLQIQTKSNLNRKKQMKEKATPTLEEEKVSGD